MSTCMDYIYEDYTSGAFILDGIFSITYNSQMPEKL